MRAQGGDWNGQVKLGNNEFYGVNYLQSVTPSLALGGEAFWLGQQRKSGAGFAARHADAAHVATCQVATTGLVSLTYLQKVSEKARARHPRALRGRAARLAPSPSPATRRPARVGPAARVLRVRPCGSGIGAARPPADLLAAARLRTAHALCTPRRPPSPSAPSLSSCCARPWRAGTNPQPT
jgi:hypothetical protein